MKLKQTLSSLCGIITLFALTTSLCAQVTIGSTKKPVDGALLMLDDATTGGSGENAKKGLGLPRVELQAYDVLKMGATATEYTEKEEHAGLVVYNLNPAFDECEATSIPSGLHVWDGGKWVGIGTPKHKEPAPPDVSSPIYQPNAYMVSTGSTSSVTIPVAKAFAVWEYWASEAGGKKLVPTPFTGALSVAVVWQEGMGQAGNANNPIVGTPTLSSTSIADQTATITVPTTGNAGNAVVSLSDGNGVRWSWHIWVTATPATTVFNGLTWMDRNLGATSATPAADGTIGLHYQWGRHTPIPGYTKFTTPNNTTTVLVTPTAISSALAPDGNGGQNALAHAINKSLDFIMNGSGSRDWYSNTAAQWDTRWAEQTKDECNNVYDLPTITNPCPSGWKVPVGTNNHNDSPWAGLTDTNGTWNNGYNWTDPAVPAGYYPAAGYRNSDSGSLYNVGSGGTYWSASPFSSHARYLNFRSGGLSPWFNFYRALGFSVRCVQE